MNKHTIAIVTIALGLMNIANAAPPRWVVTCDPPKGVNVAAFTERDGPKSVFDTEAGAYISHPKETNRWMLTVNRDGTGTETDFNSDGTSTAITLRSIGADENVMGFIFEATGTANLITLYPKDSVAIIAVTAYGGIHRAIPVGSVYISHCQFSRVLRNAGSH